MSVIATSTPTVSPVLIIGAAGVLLGNAFTMVAPTPYYKEKERTKVFERVGRIISFLGALAALVGTTLQGKQPAHGSVAFFALMVAEVGMAYILAPVAWRALKSFFGYEEGAKQDTGNNVISAVVAFLATVFTASILARLVWRYLKSLILSAEADNKRDDES